MAAGTPTGTSKTGIQWYNFPGYDDHGVISAAILIPPNRRIVTTAGHVGSNEEGKLPDTLEGEIEACFVVRIIPSPRKYPSISVSSHTQNALSKVLTVSHDQKVEKSIKQVDPSLTSEEIWSSIYTVTSFATEPFTKEHVDALTRIMQKYFKDHRPNWTMIGAKELFRGVHFEMDVQAALP